MFRLLDVSAALDARGYRDDIAHVVSLAVEDELLPENRGPWRVAVEGGKASVESVDNATMTIPIGTLSAIYTGFLSPSAARAVGLLEAGESEIRALEGIFGGPAPWLTDFF